MSVMHGSLHAMLSQLKQRELTGKKVSGGALTTLNTRNDLNNLRNKFITLYAQTRASLDDNDENLEYITQIKTRHTPTNPNPNIPTLLSQILDINQTMLTMEKLYSWATIGGYIYVFRLFRYDNTAFTQYIADLRTLRNNFWNIAIPYLHKLNPNDPTVLDTAKSLAEAFQANLNISARNTAYNATRTYTDNAALYQLHEQIKSSANGLLNILQTIETNRIKHAEQAAALNQFASPDAMYGSSEMEGIGRLMADNPNKKIKLSGNEDNDSNNDDDED